MLTPWRAAGITFVALLAMVWLLGTLWRPLALEPQHGEQVRRQPAVLVTGADGKHMVATRAVLNPVWTVTGPPGTSARLVKTPHDAVLELATPDELPMTWHPTPLGRAKQAVAVAVRAAPQIVTQMIWPNDRTVIWKGRSVQATQPVANSDFQFETRFLTRPSRRYQLQGFVVEQDPSNWIRFGTYSDGAKLNIFAAASRSGDPAFTFSAALPARDVPFLRLTRTGDTWTGEYSEDGAEWTAAGSFTQKLEARAAGLFAANSGLGVHYTAKADYFKANSGLLAHESGDGRLRQERPIVALKDDAYQVDASGAITVSAPHGVLRNDLPSAWGRASPDGSRAPAVRVTLGRQPANGTLELAPDGSFTYTAGDDYAGSDLFTYTATDGRGETQVATVTLRSAAHPPLITTGVSAFSKLVVGDSLPLTHISLAADFDQDGDLDIVGTSEDADVVALFENDGGFGFTRRDIDPDLESAYPASLADLDHDGDIDVLAGGYRADEHVWYENNGAGGFLKHVLSRQNGPHSLFAADMDRDGDLDVVTTGQDEDTIGWLENDGAQRFSLHVIDGEAMAPKSAFPVDLDKDGDLDLVAASHDGNAVIVYENDGLQSFAKTVIDSDAHEAYYATAADFDGDGDMDIVSASRLDHTVAWYPQQDGNFSKRIITRNALGARFVAPVDLEGDGDIDIIAASVDDNTIAAHLNDGHGSFTVTVVDNAAIGAYGAVPMDMNGDGLVDILGASKTDGVTSILFQEKAQDLVIDPGETRRIDKALLSAKARGLTAAELVYQVVNAPRFGELLLGDSPLTTEATFTQADVDAGRVSYRAPQHTGLDSFRLAAGEGLASAPIASFRMTIGAPEFAGGITDDFAPMILAR